MDNQALFYPKKEVSIGNYCFKQGVAVEIHSCKDTTFDWVKIKFTENFQENILLAQEDTVSIKMGYNGNLKEVFRGFLNKSYNAASGTDEILVKDSMLLLNRTVITNTYLNVTPQEIVTFGLEKAGIDSYCLADIAYPIKSKVSITKMGFMDVIKKVNQIWGLNHKGYFIGNTFYWGFMESQDNVFEFAYGSNIIALTRESGLWMLTTVSIPYIRQGMKIKVNHPKINGIFEVTKMIFKTNEAGFIRTELYFEDTV